MKILALIPARMGSSRFPGKPLKKIKNKSMIEIIYNSVEKSREISDTYIATCDEEILEHTNLFGGKAVMTASSHERASDRCAEALLKIEKEKNIVYDSMMINQAVSPLINNKNILVSNLLGSIKSKKVFEDKNCIKVVCDLNFNALYFSRQPIPTINISKNIKIYKQVCVIPFRRDFLLEYSNLEPTPLELAESIDMMRVLEHGYKVKMVPTEFESFPVDTPEDLKIVSKFFK
jgi:3-deoxy-manno-octulosonate cytidylyltransferase (CMP-KDO synthetase)